MNKKTWMVLAAMAAGSCGIPAVAQNDDAKPVEAVDLVRSPQRYWAKSFVFADVLRTHPSGGRLKFDGWHYISFSTQEAGKCYVMAELAHVLEALPLERRYHFIGTMLQQGRRFFIIVRGVSAAVEQSDLKLNWPEISDSSPADHMKNQSLRLILDVLTAAESAQVAYADEKGVALSDLYDPRSPHYGKAMGLMRSTIMAQEQKAKLPASEMLAHYLFQVLVARHPAQEKPAQTPESPAEMEMDRFPIESRVEKVLAMLSGRQWLYDAFLVERASVHAGLALFGVLLAPVESVVAAALNAWSRKNECEADRFAAKTTAGPEELVGALKKLSVQNLSNLTPHPWHVALHYSHPPLLQRIAAIRAGRG